MTGLVDKVVLVTGAARGSGRVHCEQFADEGADVIALDGQAAAGELSDTAREVANRSRRCVTGLADVGDLEAVTAAIDHGAAELGRLDVIVANGWLTLKGEVEHQYENNAAFEAVRRVPGVGGITNEIKVITAGIDG